MLLGTGTGGDLHSNITAQMPSSTDTIRASEQRSKNTPVQLRAPLEAGHEQEFCFFERVLASLGGRPLRRMGSRVASSASRAKTR